MNDDKFGLLVPLAVFLIIALAGMYIISTQAKPHNVYISQESVKNTISVSGEAKTKVAPNQVRISFSVETNDTSSAKLAQEKNSKIVEKVKKALIAAGLNTQDIETTQFSVQPILESKWNCKNKDEKNCDYYDRNYYTEIVGYKAMHGMSVKSDDTSKAGEILDAIAKAADKDAKINFVSFTLKDETKKLIENQLLEKAAQDAKSKAQRIASGVGAALGKPKAVSESIVYPYYLSKTSQVMETRSALSVDASAQKAAATEIFQSEIDVTATISATFEVG